MKYLIFIVLVLIFPNTSISQSIPSLEGNVANLPVREQHLTDDSEIVWSVGAEYLLSKNISLIASY